MICDKINLSKGSSGDSVKELQEYLTQSKYYTGRIDGKYGDYTANAVKQLQKQYGLKQDGIFGPVTCKKIHGTVSSTDISNTNGSIPLSQYVDITNRYNNYIKQHGTQPKILYLDIIKKDKYITLAKYNDMTTRYNNYIKNHGKKPQLLYIQDPNKKTITSTTTSSDKNNSTILITITNGVYFSKPHWTSTGCNKLGQCTPYYCAPHSLHQVLAKFNIDKYTEGQLAGIMGTTTAGTGHSGINTAIKYVSNKTGVKLDYEWKNFSDFGSTTTERFVGLGKQISHSNIDCIIHSQYRYGESNRGRGFGHYETVWQIDPRNRVVSVLNSLGSHSTRSAYYGYIEKRGFDRFAKYISHTYAGQKSICLITKE